jgi:predicted nucleotidyltransferase
LSVSQTKIGGGYSSRDLNVQLNVLSIKVAICYKKMDMFVQMKDQILDIAVDELVKKHGCHTVILYGSRGRGDWTEESDYDLIGFRDDGEKFRDARLIEGKYLDAFVYPVKDIAGQEKEFLRIRQGKILLERDSFARELLAKLDQVFAEGPKPLPEDEIQTIRVWIGKMLARIGKGDIEGNYRRAWLQYDLIESYFALRKRWYLGPKESFRWLSVHDSDAYSLFERALKPEAKWDDLKRLAEKVLSE